VSKCRGEGYFSSAEEFPRSLPKFEREEAAAAAPDLFYKLREFFWGAIHLLGVINISGVLLDACYCDSNTAMMKRRDIGTATSRAFHGALLFSFRVLIALVHLQEAIVPISASTMHMQGPPHPPQDLQPPQDTFPSMSDALEMAALSSLIYAFHTEDDGNSDDDDTATDSVCGRINAHNSSEINGRPVPRDVICHWYHHDWTGGSQVMIVSSAPKKYVAIVFAGTDDLRTSLTDANLLLTRFGTAGATATATENGTMMTATPAVNATYNISLKNPNIQVHAGFNHAVFNRDLFGRIVARIQPLLLMNQSSPTMPAATTTRRLFTTGHSLGAANAILTAAALQRYAELYPDEAAVFVPTQITSINFGCPMTGNTDWRHYMHSPASSRVRVWRFVLGWDVVPRLPQPFRHVGHTVQLSNKDPNRTAAVYYHHVGNGTLHYAGVPYGWSATPFLWVPGALLSHSMHRYYDFLANMSSSSWIREFVPSPKTPNSKNNSDRNDDHHLPHVDDDFYVDPPDDDYRVFGL
jgi:Lipase (class 3)